MRTSLLVFICVVAAGCAGSPGEGREVPVAVTRQVTVEVTREVPVEVTRHVTFEVIREVPVEVIREVPVEVEVPVPVEVEMTRENPVTVEVTPTLTPIPPATPTPAPTPTPRVDVRDVDYVRDIEIPAEFVINAVNAAAAYCDNRTFSVSHEVNDHFHRFFGIEAGTDECRADALAAMAVRSKRVSETHTRYIFKGNKFRECHYDSHNDSYYSKGDRLQEKCDFVELYAARHLPEYDRERLIVMFEDQPPAYPFEYLLTQDELWARNRIWRSLIRYFHFQCMNRAEAEEGRVFYFDRDAYIGHLPNSIESWFSLGYRLPSAYWATDGPNVGLCSAYDIKTRAEYEMWHYDFTYFGYLAIGFPSADAEQKPGSVNFTQDLAEMRAKPPEIPSRFAAD